MRSRVYSIIAIISLVLIILWLHIALLPEGGLIAIAAVISTANLYWLMPAFALFAIAYILRAIRWWFLLRPFRTKGNPGTLFPMLVGGIFLTYVVPLRAGDIATPYWLREKTGTRFTAGLASVLLARLLDFASLILIVVLFAILLFGSIFNVMRYLIVGFIMAIAFIAFFLLIRNNRFVGFISGLLGRLFKPSKRLSEEVPDFVGNAAIDMRNVIGSWNSGWALLISVPLWVLETMKLSFLALAFGVPLDFIAGSFSAAISYVGGHGLAILIPAGIGIFLIQTITLSSWLVILGVPDAVIASIALLDGLVYVIGLTILGVPSIASMGRGYRSLQEDEKQVSISKQVDG
jgi:uncharacterized protein (TIRG00374 family)